MQQITSYNYQHIFWILLQQQWVGWVLTHILCQNVVNFMLKARADFSHIPTNLQWPVSPVHCLKYQLANGRLTLILCCSTQTQYKTHKISWKQARSTRLNTFCLHIIQGYFVNNRDTHTAARCNYQRALQQNTHRLLASLSLAGQTCTLSSPTQRPGLGLFFITIVVQQRDNVLL